MIWEKHENTRNIADRCENLTENWIRRKTSIRNG